MKPVVKLDTRVLDRMIAAHPVEASEIVRSTAFAVEGEAKSRAPVDTGALKDSINTKMDGQLRATVSDGVEYGIYQEFGTSRMAAQPFMIPAVEQVRPTWRKLWREFFRRWR